VLYGDDITTQPHKPYFLHLTELDNKTSLHYFDLSVITYLFFKLWLPQIVTGTHISFSYRCCNDCMSAAPKEIPHKMNFPQNQLARKIL